MGTHVGSFGAVSAFSLSKHFPGRGGVLALDREISRRDVVLLRDRLMLPRPIGKGAVRAARSAARARLETLHLTRGLDRWRRLTHPPSPAPWRVPLHAPRLDHARSSGDLGQFDAWMETAYPDYRMRQRSTPLKWTLGALRDLGRDREERIAGVLRLRALDAVAPAAREGDPLPLLRVPLLIEDRDAVALELRRRGINVFFVYAPPLDDYSGPEFCEPSPLPEAGTVVGQPHPPRRPTRCGACSRPGREEPDPPDPRHPRHRSGRDVAALRAVPARELTIPAGIGRPIGTFDLLFGPRGRHVPLRAADRRPPRRRRISPGRSSGIVLDPGIPVEDPNHRG